MSRVFLSIKVCGQEVFREGFLDGRLYMNTLGYFRRYEEGASANIADRHEGTSMLLQPGQFTMTITGDGLPDGQFTFPAEDFAGPAVIRHNKYDLLNVLCVYAVHERGHTFTSDADFERFVDSQMMRSEVDELGGYAAVVIDSKAFQERVVHAIRERNFNAVAGLVEYYDPSTFHGAFDDAQAVLRKRADYSHQREYRYALDRGVRAEAPYTLEVGSLRDIAIGCRTSEVNGFISDFLHQMKAQGVFG